MSYIAFNVTLGKTERPLIRQWVYDISVGCLAEGDGTNEKIPEFHVRIPA